MKKAIFILIPIILIFFILLIGLFIFFKSTDKNNKETNQLQNFYDTSNTNTDDRKNSDLNKRLIFIHHSTGENWLADDWGELGKTLMENGYIVSDTNYGWGPDGIGDLTDIGQWWLWFRGPDSKTYLKALFEESEQHADYSRIEPKQSDENTIIMFKSCFPNSALMGNPDDPIPPISRNPLKGEDSGSKYHTIANAKGIYIDLLEYFKTRQDKLFIVITAPPLSDPTFADNAREFNNWLTNDWLKDYKYNNVAVFDFFNVLADKNTNTLKYPSDDDHPNPTGSKKATEEFIPFLNSVYNTWQQDNGL